MKTEESNGALVILRWIGVLPSAVLAAWIAWIVVSILSRFSLAFAYISPDDFQGKLFTITAGHAAMGAAFVYFGTILAPSHRVIVAFVLGGVGAVVSGILLFPAMIVKDWWAVWGALFVAIGAGTVVWSVHKGETKLD